MLKTHHGDPGPQPVSRPLPSGSLRVNPLDRIDTDSSWPLHNIAITNSVWCIAYKRRVGEWGVPCAVVVQYHWNSVGITGWGGGGMMIGSFTKSVEVNEYLVKAKIRRLPEGLTPG